MKIFIGNIPNNLSHYELRRFITSALANRNVGMQFWKRREPEELSLQMHEKHTPTGSYRYAVATITPISLAEECIQLLDQHFFRDRPLEVREYHKRGYSNERRAVNWRDKPWHGIERRMGDRRQILPKHDSLQTATA